MTPPTSFPALHQTYAAAVPELSVPHAAEVPPAPTLLHLNEQLARELGFDPDQLRSPEGIALLTGQVDGRAQPRIDPSALDEGAPAAPFTTAQAYAGYQFGSPNPQLGDGRAVLLGDLLDVRGRRRDLHLKGSGRTPFSRPGSDGKAPLGPMLRELVIGEALHALGVPTTRALAVIGTGERIRPRRGVTPEPGAILVRCAASHLRVGTLEFAAWHHPLPVRRALLEHVIDRHWPAAREAENPALTVLESVALAQADLVAQWMLLGFVHGVMNTDNMALSGESIDFGPCAFLDVHRERAVFSSIDRGGRYAYGRQPGIALWNLSRLAEAMLELIDPEDPQAAVDAATAVLEKFEPRYLESWARGMAAKLGIPVSGADDTARLAQVRALGADLFALMESAGADHTAFLRALAESEAPGPVGPDAAEPAGVGPVHGLDPVDPVPGPEPVALLPEDDSRRAFAAWHARLRELRGTGDRADAARTAMTSANPVRIPRNAHLEQALRAAELGDLAPVERMLDSARDPFTRRPDLAVLETPGEGAEHVVTFCGT